MRYFKLLTITFIMLTLFSGYKAKAQLDNDNINSRYLLGQLEHGSRIIMTGVPILSIAPDSRSGAMGDVGAATTPDGASIHWNAAKLAFMEKDAGVSFTYTPWLREIVSDISLLYLSGYMHHKRVQAID